MKRSEAIKYRKQIESSAVSTSDNDALEQKWMYPKWIVGNSYSAGDRVRDSEELYKCATSHTSQSDWQPHLTPTLWNVIKIGHSGTIDDPIEAEVGLNYVKDLYYIENEVKYLCIRQDTPEGTVLYYMPHDLIGVYFEIIE